MDPFQMHLQNDSQGLLIFGTINITHKSITYEWLRSVIY